MTRNGTFLIRMPLPSAPRLDQKVFNYGLSEKATRAALSKSACVKDPPLLKDQSRIVT